MTEPETYAFPADGGFPNSPLPLLVYRRVLLADADTIEGRFAANGWSNPWRDGVFPFHHFHSIAHEVLGVAAGEVRVAFGGPSGQLVAIQAGDVAVIPAGLSHCNRGQSPGLLIVGAYPGGAAYDIKLGDPGDYAAAAQAARAVELPASDPLCGCSGPLLRLWGGTPLNPAR